MNKVTMDRAKEEAKRFLKAISEMEQRFDADENAWFGCVESGRLRRSSMDLSRALTDLRRPG
jgi:hypothetical protein